MPLSPGTKLGPYEIVAAVGAGGMGEVYRARDTRLGREVALKVLPSSFSSDAERLRRFEQEARAVAALNHSNILAIHDIGTHEGAPFLVTELLKGETLRERLRGGPLPVRKALEVAIQAAHGIAAAHEKGIIHRDLKPANIFVTTDGRVKLLDFGLAKLTQGDDSGISETQSPTRTADPITQTGAGAVLGTAAYMSPEQVRGKPSDARSDIFALGTILYEMLSGQRAFEKDSSADTMAAILKEEPAELSGDGRKVPPAVEHIVRHCLEKNPAERFQSARDLAFDLESVSGISTTSAAALSETQSPQRKWLVVATGMLLIGLLAGFSITALVLRRSGSSVWEAGGRSERMQFTIPVAGQVNSLALSADGRMLAFVIPDETSGSNIIYVQRVGGGEARALPGTEGATYPAWSPDGTYLAFFADGKLKKVAVAGGEPLVLGGASMGRGISWGSKGVILYAPAPGGGLWQIHADGTGAAPVVIAKEFVRWPAFLPDGEHYLFWAGNFDVSPEDKVSGIYFSSLGSQDKKLLVLARSNPGYGAGALFYLDAKLRLVSVPLDTSRGRLTGEPNVVATAVAYSPSTYWANFAVAANGTTVYDGSSGVALSQLTWYDRSGKQLGTVSDAGVVANPAISPDGRLVVVDMNDLKSRNIDLWIDDLVRSTNSRFTFTPSEDAGGVWSRDGISIAYGATLNGPNLHIKKANGLQPARVVVTAGQPVGSDWLTPNSWSASDQNILCTQQTSPESKLVLVDVTSGAVTPFLSASGSQAAGQVSPDGKWVAYASSESGEWEIYATSFPDGAGKWQVSRGGGTQPRWSREGKEILYVAPKNALTAVPVSTDGGFSTGVPARLFQVHSRPPVSNTDFYTYDVSKDGKRFLVSRYVKPELNPPLHIVLNAGAAAEK
jgi:serine/threonine protein kinase/Tol biopolymer transport system component